MDIEPHHQISLLYEKLILLFDKFEELKQKIEVLEEEVKNRIGELEYKTNRINK